MNTTLQIQKELGEGGYSKVFLVKNTISSKSDALKIIKVNKNDKNNYLYHEEIKNLCKLNNPYIVKYIFSWSSEFDEFNINKNKNQKENENFNYIYILMEYCENSLDKFIEERNKKFFQENRKNKKLNKNEWFLYLKLIIEIIESISFIHKKNIIHRDIKPSNIFLKYTGDKKDDFDIFDKDNEIINYKIQIKLGDFGISKSFNLNENKEIYFDRNINLMKKDKKPNSNNSKDSINDDDNNSTKTLKKHHINDLKSNNFKKKEELTENMGTIFYMSPENIKTKNSDLYSLGITLFLLIYPLKTTHEKFIEINNLKNKNDFSKKLKELYPSISELFLKLVNKEENKRPELKLIKNAFKNEFLNILFDKEVYNNFIKVEIKLESKGKYKKYFIEVNKKKIKIKKKLEDKKIYRKINLNNYTISKKEEIIILESKKLEDIKIKMNQLEHINYLFKLIDIINHIIY